MGALAIPRPATPRSRIRAALESILRSLDRAEQWDGEAEVYLELSAPGLPHLDVSAAGGLVQIRLAE